GEDWMDNSFADEVVSHKCDNSLNGTHNQLWARFMYMGHIIEIVDIYSDCPPPTESLSYNILVDGQPLFNDVTKVSMSPQTQQNSNTSNYGYGYYSSSSSSTALSGLSIETAENIKRLVAEKIENRNQSKREVRKY